MQYPTYLIAEKLRRFPNAGLTAAPTPIYKMKRVSADLGCNIYIMREDLTGFGIGGNKVRKLDYLIADAVAKGVDSLVTLRASSLSRNAAAAACVFGLDLHVVLAGTESKQNAASQSLFKQWGANLYYTPTTDGAESDTVYLRVINELKSDGKAVYELHPGGSDEIGTLGYINAFDQILHYSEKTGVHFHNIILAAGSAGTQAGLILGQSIADYEASIIGMAASRKSQAQCELVGDLAQETAHALEIQFAASRIVVDDRFIGPGYALPSDEGGKAAHMLAAREGVLLDDVYTAKTAAGLVSYASDNRFREDENVLFIHTGGNSGLYY